MLKSENAAAADGPGEISPGAELVGAFAKTFRGSQSPNTERALRSDWRIFSTWCRENGVEALPASAETVAAFVDAMAQVRAPATVRRYVASIVWVQRFEGLDDASVRGEPVRQALRRMHREKGRRQRQARAVDWSLLQRMLAATGERLIDARNRALIAVGYDTLLRRSELVALEVGDIIVERDGSATVVVHRSKTDPEGEGAQLWIAPDTVKHVQEWLDRSAVRTDKIFRALPNGSVGAPLDAKEVPRIYKEMARKAGLSAREVKTISAHSTRVGGTQDMVAAGIGMASIMQAGRWKSEASVIRYAAALLAKRNGAAQLARIQRRW